MTARNLAGRVAAMEAHTMTTLPPARVSPIPIGESDDRRPWEPMTEAEWVAAYGLKETADDQQH